VTPCVLSSAGKDAHQMPDLVLHQDRPKPASAVHWKAMYLSGTRPDIPV
jgi:hypothetical protein